MIRSNIGNSLTGGFNNLADTMSTYKAVKDKTTKQAIKQPIENADLNLNNGDANLSPQLPNIKTKISNDLNYNKIWNELKPYNDVIIDKLMNTKLLDED